MGKVRGSVVGDERERNEFLGCVCVQVHMLMGTYEEAGGGWPVGRYISLGGRFSCCLSYTGNDLTDDLTLSAPIYAGLTLMCADSGILAS